MKLTDEGEGTSPTAKALWEAPQIAVFGHIREIVLMSGAKGSPLADGMGDSRKNTTSQG